jgi:hypothetical protein
VQPQKKHFVSTLLGIFLLLSCGPVLGQVMLDQGIPLKISKQLTFRGLSETFDEWWLFDPPVRQVAIFGMTFEGDTFGIGEAINVEIFRNSLDYFYGTNGTNMIFHGPSNQIRFVTPLTWTTNTAFARVTMIVGSASFTNLNLATKSVGADGMANVYRTNIAFMVPSPRMALTMNTGDQWSFQSSVLNGGLTATFAENGGRQYARIRFKTLLPTLTENELLRLDVFENEATGNHVASKIFNGPIDEGQMDVIGAWPDRQGAVRLTMLSGSITITNLTLISAFPGPSGLALIFQTNIVSFSPSTPGPRLTVDNSYTWLFGVSYLLWPTNAVGYQLEESEALPQSPWRPVTNRVATIDTNHFYEVDVYWSARPQRYYRLRKAF